MFSGMNSDRFCSGFYEFISSDQEISEITGKKDIIEKLSYNPKRGFKFKNIRHQCFTFGFAEEMLMVH